MNELHIGLAFIFSSALPVLLAFAWRYLRQAYRRLRNLDELAAAQRQARIALRMSCISQEAAKASREQLAVCRGLLAVTMRERDHHERACTHLAGKIIQLEREKRHQRLMARTWLTRTILSRKVGEN